MALTSEEIIETCAAVFPERKGHIYIEEGDLGPKNMRLNIPGINPYLGQAARDLGIPKESIVLHTDWVDASLPIAISLTPKATKEELEQVLQEGKRRFDAAHLNPVHEANTPDSEVAPVQVNLPPKEIAR